MNNNEKFYEKGGEVKSMTPYTVSMLGGSNSGWTELSTSAAKSITEKAADSKAEPTDQPSTFPNLAGAKVIALNAERTVSTQFGNYIPGIDTPPEFQINANITDLGVIVGGSNQAEGITENIGSVASINTPAPADANYTIGTGEVEKPLSQAEQTKEFIAAIQEMSGAKVVTAEDLKATKRGRKSAEDKVTLVDTSGDAKLEHATI